MPVARYGSNNSCRGQQRGRDDRQAIYWNQELCITQHAIASEVMQGMGIPLRTLLAAAAQQQRRQQPLKSQIPAPASVQVRNQQGPAPAASCIIRGKPGCFSEAANPLSARACSGHRHSPAARPSGTTSSLHRNPSQLPLRLSTCRQD